MVRDGILHMCGNFKSYMMAELTYMICERKSIKYMFDVDANFKKLD